MDIEVVSAAFLRLILLGLIQSCVFQETTTSNTVDTAAVVFTTANGTVGGSSGTTTTPSITEETTTSSTVDTASVVFTTANGTAPGSSGTTTTPSITEETTTSSTVDTATVVLTTANGTAPETTTSNTIDTTSLVFTTANGTVPDVTSNTDQCLPIAVTGGILFIVCSGFVGCLWWITKEWGIPEEFVFIVVADALFVVLLAISLGLCYGVPDNNSAFIAAIAIGSISIVAMVAAMGFYIWYKTRDPPLCAGQD